MSTGEPAGEGGGGGGESTPGGDHSASTPGVGIPSGIITGIQHPPPSPLSGCYLLVVLPEPHTAQHKDLIVNRLAKGFLSWDKDSCHVDLEKELQALVTQAPEGEEARNGERLIQYATENLVTEVLIHPQTNTLLQCIRNLLASFTKHRHIIHAGYTFSGNGSWILQDGTFSLADFLDAFSEHEVQRVIRAYENSVTVDIHCAGVGDWTSSRLSKEACARSCRVRVNPDDVLTAGVPAISSFTEYVAQYLVAQTLDQLMEPSDVVGNIRFSHPTLYVFPGGQGDAALFGINGFNMLVDGGFARKACFWDFARHLDRLDAVLLTRVNNSNIGGMSSVLRKKQEMHVYPQIGHFFCNLVERRGANSPDGDKDVDPLILNLTDLGQEMMVNLRHINLRAHPCYRDLDPINLYHKVGHGTLDMYVLSPSKDTREVREFLTKWQTSDSKLFAGSHKKDSNHLTFPIQNLVSICALLVWQPANPEDTITRILFPGSTPQNKIFEGLERLKHLEFMKHPICSAKSLSPSTSLAALKEKSNKQKTSIIEKSVDKDKDKDKDKDIKRISDYRKEKKDTLDTKTVKGVEESSPKPAAVPSAPIIPTKQPAKVDVKAKKVVENKKIEKETKTDSKKIEKELKEVKKDIVKREVVKIDKQDAETKKTDVVKTEIEKTAITKESKPKPEPKRKEIKETRTVVKSKVEATPKAAPKPSVDKKLKPSIEKKDVKSSPTTPKKIINGTASRTEITKTSSKSTVKTTSSRTVSSMPAKSAKDATNRKVVESKNLTTSSTPAVPAPKAPSVTAKPRSTDRKPISRRPKTGSPSKPRLSSSPAKSTRSTPTVPAKTEKDSVIRRPKSEKPVTDASGVSTPSAIELESVVKLVDKSLTEKSDDISIDSIESKVLADLKEEREVVEEIEAVLSKAERNEIARKDDQLEGDDEITAEVTDKKEDDVTEEDVTAEIEDVPKKVGSRKESQEFTEEDEYLIVEKEEIYTEDSALSGEGEQKHLLDEVESEKAKKYLVSKDLDVPEEDEEPKEKDEMEEKEKEEKRERKIQFHDKPEVGEITPAGLSPTRKEQLEEEVKEIIASATEIIQKTDERDDSGKKDSEDITKEPSSVSPDKFDSSEKKTDTDLKPEADQKEQVPEKLEESQDRISTLESGATTTAPTLPEDERITLDEIKEDVDEKHVKEEVKEKEIPQPVKHEQILTEVPPPLPSATMKSFVIRETVSTVQRDIVKTPDEVADLPVHEEVDPKLYDMDDYDKVKEDKVPQTPEAKEPPTPPVKEQKGMFSFFGKVADKFEKGMDKLTGKSKKDAEKEADEKSSKSSSPKETRPHDKTGFEEVDMGKVFAKVGKIEPHTTDAFEKAKPQTPADIKVAAIKETAAFLQQEIKETKIDTVEQPVIPTELKKPVEEINVLKDIAEKLDTAIDDSKDKPLDLTSKKEEILSEELVEVEALLEEASKKFVTVKDSLRDSLESLEDKIEDIVDDAQPIDAKDSIQSTLTGVAERLEDLRPQFDDTADSKEPNKVKFEIPKDGEEGEEDSSDEYSGPVRDVKGAVRDVGGVLAGTAGIVIDDKPKDVIEIVKKVAEVLKEDNFLSEQVLFDKPIPKDDEKPKDEQSHPKPIIEDILMPKKVGITEELPPQEEIEEMLEGGIARPLPAYERAGGIEVEEEPCVKVVKDAKVDIKSPMKETAAPFGDDVKDLCSDLIEVKEPVTTPKPTVDHHEGKVDVMEAGIEEVCTKKAVKRELADEDQEEVEDDQELEQSEILFQQKLAPAQAELVMVTPDSAPTSPKFSTDKVYDKELEDAVAGVSKVPGVPKEIEEFISSKADVYDIIDEVIKKGRKITIEIIEYIVIVKKVSREHVIYIIEEIIINKGISPESVIEDVDILKSQESTNDLIISSVKRVEIEEYIIAEYIMKGKRITILTIEEIAIKKVVPKRIVIEIIEEIIIKRKISRESVYQMTEEEFVNEVKPIYDEFERQPRRESQVTFEPIVEAEKPKTIDGKLSPEPVHTGMTLAKVEETSPKDEKPKSPEPTKEKDAPIFDEKDLDEGKLIDDFVNVSSKDAVMSFLHEERKLSEVKHDSKPDSKIPVTDDTVKDLGDDFEAVEQEYKVHDVPTTTASTIHPITDLRDKDDVLEAVEDDLDDVIEAAEKFVEETKEKPEGLKETSVPDVLAVKVTGKDSITAVTSETELVPEVKDDKVPSKVSDKPIVDSASVMVSDTSITTEKYLDEDKEKTTTVTSESPKLSKDTKEILDDIEDAIKDIVTLVPDQVQDFKDAATKLDKPDLETDDKDDHSKKPSTDKHDVDDKVGEKEPVHKDEAHVVDVTTKSPIDDKDHHELVSDIKTVTGKIDEPVKELKETPENVKETVVPDAVATDKVQEKYSVKPEIELVPGVKDDEVLLKTDKTIDDKIIPSEVSIATEKYLDEEKEKPTVVASESPKHSEVELKILDEIKDATQVTDELRAIHDVEDASLKLDKPEPKSDKKEDHPEETPADKHDVDTKLAEKVLEHEEKGHVTDVTIRAPLDDKGHHPELTVDIESRISPERDTIADKINDTGDIVDKKDHVKEVKLDTVPDVTDVKDAAPKSDEPEIKTDEKDDHPKETSSDKHDVDAKVEEEPLHKEKAHITDVTIRSPHDDTGRHPELDVDIATTAHKTHEPKEKAEKEDHIEGKEIGKPQPETGKEDLKEIAQTPDVAEKIAELEQLDKKIPEAAEIKKSPSKESVQEDGDIKKLPGDVTEKTEDVKVKEIVSEVTDVKRVDTSEIVDLKQFDVKVDEKKEDKETDKISKEGTPTSPDHAAESMITDSSCFNIGKPESHPAPIKELPLDVHDKSDDELDKIPKHPGVSRKDTELDDDEKELDHFVRKKRSLGEDIIEPEELDEEPTDTVRKSVDLAPSVTEKDHTLPKDLASAGEKPGDDDDDKEVGTVRRMVVTASSEDGGHEIELCPTGSITFGKSVTPDDSLRDVSTKSTPDKDSLQLEKDSLYSGKSTPEKDSISEKSISDLKDDKGTPEDSLEKSITGHDGPKKSHIEEPEETKPAVLDEVASKIPKDVSHELVDEKISEKPTEEVPTKPMEITPAASEKPAEIVPEKSTEKVAEKLPHEVLDKPAGTVPDTKPGEVSGKPTETIPEKPTDIPGLKSPEKAPSEDISPAETVFDKSPTDKHADALSKEPTDSHSKSPSLPSEKLDHIASGEHPPIVPTCIVPEEYDASRKSSIASVKPDEADTLVDKDHKAESSSPTKDSSIVSEKLDDKVSSVEAKKDKSPSPISVKTTDKLDEKEQKEKTPSPEMREEKEMPKTPNVTPEDDKHPLSTDKLEEERSASPIADKSAETPKSPSLVADKVAEEKAPVDKSLSEISPLPTSDKDSDKPRSPSIHDEIPKDRTPSPTADKVLDQSHTEKLVEQDVTDDKLHKDKSPSPISDDKIDKVVAQSITSVELVEAHISEEIAQKDKSPSPVEPAEKSRTPSITSEKLSDKDAPEDEDNIPTPKADKTTDRQRTPEETHDKNVIVGADKSRASSITSEKPDLEDVHEPTTQKDKSPSPVSGEKLDKSRSPSITPEKLTEQVKLDDTVHKEKTPSPTPSLTSGKPGEKDILEIEDHKDKPEEKPERSRTSSIASEKPEDEITPHGEVQKERSPSPVTDDKTRKPSIITDKPETKDIPDSTVQKDKSPSPAVGEIPDKSRTPSIVPDKLTEHFVHGDKSPSPNADETADKSRSPSVSLDKPDVKDIPESTTEKPESRSPSITSMVPDVEDVVKSIEHKEKSPSRTPDQAGEKSRTPSIVPEEEKETDEKLKPSITPGISETSSPTPEDADTSRKLSIISDKVEEKDVPHQVQKERSLSPTVDHTTAESKPGIVSGKPDEKDTLDGEIHKDRSPSPTTDKVTDKSRSPSVTSERPDEKIPETKEQQDKSLSPTTDVRTDRHSRTSSISSVKLDDKDVPDDKLHKERSPSPAADNVTDKSRSPSVASEKPDEKTPESKSPMIDEKADIHSRTSSISSVKLDDKDVPDDKLHKERSPSPAADNVTDKSRSPSVASEKPDEKTPESKSPMIDEKADIHSRTSSISSVKLDDKDVPDDKLHKERSPSPAADRVTDKSRSPSVASEKPDEKTPESKSPMIDEKADIHSRTSSISTVKPDDKDIPDDKLHKERSPSPAADNVTDKSRSPSVASEKPDEKTPESKSPMIDEKADIHSRTSSISSVKLDDKDVPDDKLHKERSPSPAADRVTDKSRSPSVASEKPDEKTPESKSPMIDEKADIHSRTSSISTVKPDDKDIPDDKLHKERSPSPAADNVTDKSRSPSVASEKPDEKTPESKSPMIDEKADIHSRTSSISSVKLDDKDVPDDKLHKERSPSPAADRVTDKSRSPSVASEKPDEKTPESKSPMIDEKADIHSRTSSISSVKPDDKDIPDDKLHKERSPSPAADRVTDKSRSPSVASEKPDEKTPESKSPMIDEKADIHSRTSSISSVKLDDKDVPDDKLHKERSPSPAADKVTDKSRSSSIISEKPDEKDVLETIHTQKDKSQSPTDRRSRSPSPAELDEKEKLTKDKSPSPSTDEVTVPSRSPSIMPEKLDEHDVHTAQFPKDTSPLPTVDVATERSRTSSIASEKLAEIDTSDIKVQKDVSPSPTADKVTEKLVEKTITHEIIGTVVVQTEKSPKEVSPTPLDHGEPIKPEGTSVIADKTDEKYRSPSIVSEKLEDKHIPDLEHPKDKSPSPSTDKPVDQSKVSSVPDHKPEEKVPSPVDGKVDEKPGRKESEKSPSPISELSDKIRSPSLSSEEPEEKAPSPVGEKVEDNKPDQKSEKDRSPSPGVIEIADRSRSPSIASDKTEVKELTEKPKSPITADVKPEETKDSDKPDDNIDPLEKSKSPLGDAPKKEVSGVSKSPDFDEEKPTEVTDKEITEAKEPEDVPKPATITTSGKLDDAVLVGQKTDESLKSPSSLGEKQQEHSETVPSVEKPRTLDITSAELADEPKDKSRSSSVISDRSKSPSVVDDKHDDLRPSSRASVKSELEEQVDSLKSSVPTHDFGEEKEKDIHKSHSDGSLPEEPKSPGAVSDKSEMRDRSPSYDKTPKDRSRSHSLFDTGDRTPLGRSRAASLFDDKLDDKIALLEFDGHTMRPSISEEIEEDKIPVKDDDSKSGTKSPSVRDRESPVSEEDDVPASKRLEIEQYIIDEFINKKRIITLQIIEEIVIKKSVSRYIIIEIIEEIIIKLKIKRESVIDVSGIDEPEDHETDVKDKQSVLDTPEIPESTATAKVDKVEPAVTKDAKPKEIILDSQRPSIAGETSPVHDVADEKKPRGSVTVEICDLKTTESRKSSTVDDLSVEPEPHMIKKRSIGDEFLEPKTAAPEKTEPGKDDSPKPDGIDAKRPSVVDDKHPQPEPTEIEPVKIPEADAPKRPSVSVEKISEFDTLTETVGDAKKPEDQAKPDAKVIPTVVAETEEGKEIHPEGFEEEVVTVTDAKRTEIEDYIVEEYIKKSIKITREIVEEIVIKKAVPRYIILEIIEEIIVKRKISRVSVIDFVEEDITDKEDGRSTTSSISDKDDMKLRKLSEDRFDITGKSTPEISSAKDQTIDFSGKSTPDLKSSLLSEKYSDKSGYSTPDMKQFDERSGKSTPDYRTEYESQFHKAFVGGMTEMRTTHITTLSGKSTPDFGGAREDTPEPKSESQPKPDAPAGKPDAEVQVQESASVPEKHEVSDTVPKEEAPGKPAEVPTSNQSIFTTTISGITKATSELVTKISESTASTVSTVTSKILPSEPELKTTDQSGSESEPEIITKVVKHEVESHEPSETEVITTTIKYVSEIDDGEPEVITKVIKREFETHEPSDIGAITKTVKHVTETAESEPEITTKVIKRESLPADGVTKRFEVESEPEAEEVITRVLRREVEICEPSETEVITRTVRYVTESEVVEPEIITKVITREVSEPADDDSDSERFTKIIRCGIEKHEPQEIETETVTRIVRHVTEVEEEEPQIIRKVIRREVVDGVEDETSTTTYTTVKTSDSESEPEIITKTIRRVVEMEDPSETEVITRTVRHVTEYEESEPEIITKVTRREIFVSDDEEDMVTTTKTSRVTEHGDSETSETSETVTKTVKSSDGHPEVVKRIISREGTPDLTETITTRTTRTIVSEAGHPTETTTKTTTTTSNSDIEKPELITRIISREGTPEISETIKRTMKTISSDAGPEYVTRIISREGTPDIVKTSEVKRIVTTVTTVTGPDGEIVTTKDVKESSDKLNDEDLLEKLIDSSSSDKSQKSGPDVVTSEERFVTETPDGLVTEEIMKRTVTTVTSTSGTSTPDVKTFVDSGKSTPDHKEEEKVVKPDKPTPEPSKDAFGKITAEKTASEIPSSHLLKDLVTEDKAYSGKSTPDIPASPLFRDSASISGRILSGRSTPDRKSDGRSRTATPEGFRSGEIIRTIITTTRTMSDDGEIITTTKEITESTDDQGQTTILEEKTDVKRDDKLPGRDAAETAISSVIGNIKSSELKRGSSPGSDVMSDRDFGPISPRSDISSGHSRAATHIWGSSEERHTYSDDDPPSSPLSATSQFGYSPQLPRYELPFDKDAHKPGEAPGSMMTGSFYGELPSEPTTASSAKSTFMSTTTTSKNSDPIPIQGEHSTKRFTVEKEFAGGYDYRSETKKYVDDADLDFDRAMMEHREKRGEDLVSHHYSNGSSSVVYTNGNSREKSVTTTTVEKTTSSGDKKKHDPMAASFSAEEEPEEGEKSGKDPLEGWGKPLFLPSPKPPRKFNLQRPVASTSSEELNPESLNFDVINNWGEPLRLPSPAPAPAPTNEVSNKGAPGTPKKERKQPKKVVSENNKNKKRSESPSKNDKKSKDSKNKVQPVYMDLTYVPHHGNSYYSSLEFFKRIRARYYVFSGTEPSREVYDALLEAKKTWEDKNLEVTMIPTYDTDTLGYWVADNEEALAANHIDLSPSASRCTINLQDHETSCSAYRLEF